MFSCILDHSVSKIPAEALPLQWSLSWSLPFCFVECPVEVSAQICFLVDVMPEQSNAINLDDRANCTPFSSKSRQQDDGPVDFSAILNLRLEALERRVQHLEKVIQRQIRWGRMIE